MGRRFAQIHTDIWEDDDFLTLSPDARFVFIASFSQKTITYCGVMVYSAARLARSTGFTVKRVDRAVAELHQRNYVFHDEDTGEVLIRSFIRNNAVMAQSQLRKAMERSYQDVMSQRIRRLILVELGPDYDGPCRQPDGQGATRVTGSLRAGCDQGDGKGARRARIKDYGASLVATDVDVTRNPDAEPSLPGTPQLTRAELAAITAPARAKIRADHGTSDLEVSA